MISAIVDWYASQQVPLQAAILSAVTSTAVFFLGVWLNAWANRRNTLKASADSQKLDIYKDALAKIDNASRAQTEADAYIRGATIALEYSLALQDSGLHWSPPTHRYPVFSKLHTAQLEAASTLHRLIEQWAIVDPRLDIFGMAFSSEHMALLDAFTAVSPPLMRALPTDGLDGVPFPYSLPSHEYLATLHQLVDAYSHHGGRLSAYFGDLNVELQALLLGHLFGKKIVRRDPPDPTYFAIRLDRHKQIRAKFRSSEFFKRGDTLDAELRRKHGTERRGWWRTLWTQRDP